MVWNGCGYALCLSHNYKFASFKYESLCANIIPVTATVGRYKRINMDMEVVAKTFVIFQFKNNNCADPCVGLENTTQTCSGNGY